MERTEWEGVQNGAKLLASINKVDQIQSINRLNRKHIFFNI